MIDLVLRPAAAADIEDAFGWYGRLRLGEEFLAAVGLGLREIADFPLQGRALFRDTRRVLLRRFPYAVFYRAYPEVVVVIACLHTRRNPSQWRRR